MKLWGGRFTKELDTEVNDFHSSIRFDARMAHEDILGSLAHAKMLGATGIIPAEDAEKIVEGLQGILTDMEEGKIEFSLDQEDIHMNVESILTSRIGDAGKRLHTARSRNDQVALDLRMLLKREIIEIKGKAGALIAAIVRKASEHLTTVMPGYTHLQRAQPTTFAHYIMAYAEMFRRDIGRLKDCYDRTDVMPLGSGAMGSTTYPIDRQMTAAALGFSNISMNSIDAVSDRDFVIELAAALSTLMMHLSRFSEEIILWSSHEFGFVSLDDAYATGSSIMPQKKNPDVAELVRGKTGRVYGSLIGILTVMKGLPLAYNKDMQEDKEGIFDAVDTVKQCLSVFAPMFDSLNINAANMRAAASKGFLNATDCADYLTKKGIPFRDAYTVTGKLVRYCTEQNQPLESLTLTQFRSFSPVFDQDIYEVLDLLTCVSQRKVPGGPAPECVANHIQQMREWMEEEQIHA